MLFPSRAYRRLTPLSFHSCSSAAKLPYQPLRAASTTPQPRPYTQPKTPPVAGAATTRTPTKPSTYHPQSIPPTQTPHSRINPPSSTRPPNLALPFRAPTDPAFKYYFRLGKAYAQFYKAGLKALWTNYRSARNLPNGVWRKSPHDVHAAVTNGTLSRAEFQLLRRTKRDLWKLPPFALLFMICGEFTPLVIVFVTGLVPRLIWIPKQVQMAREKTEERRKDCRREGGFAHSAGQMILYDQVVDRASERYVAQSLGLYASAWDRYLPALLSSTLVQRRVESRLKDLEADDRAIARDGGVHCLHDEEVKLACEERGIDILRKEDGQLRMKLRSWVQQRTK